MKTLRRFCFVLLLLAPHLPTSVVGQEVCPGDCNDDGVVSVAELIRGVNIALGLTPVSNCPAMDTNGNGVVSVGELIAAVNSALDGCGGGGATFAEVQAIFTANCVGCHSGALPFGNLNLVEGMSFAELVGVTPDNGNAADAGLLLVDPGNSANSFLLIKVAGTPPMGFQAQMPLFADPLSEADVATIRAWIEDGANP